MRKLLLPFSAILALFLLAGWSEEISTDQLEVDPGTGPISQWVEQLTDQAELSEKALLGVAVGDWINLAISILLVVAALSILLAQLGINIGVLLAGLGLAGLALSLAARDTIGDGIAGFHILVDQYIRVGDRIEIEGAGTWSDVVEVGLRTTSIRTLDNRMIIVPNSIIGKNQVINYTFPDPRHRIATHVHVVHDTDIDSVHTVIIEAVRQVSGVLPDKPVDALYVAMGQSAIV